MITTNPPMRMTSVRDRDTLVCTAAVGRFIPVRRCSACPRYGKNLNMSYSMQKSNHKLSVFLFLCMTTLTYAATTPERSDIEDRWKWDLSSMYQSTNQWDDHYKQVEGLINEFAAKKGKASQSPEAL